MSPGRLKTNRHCVKLHARWFNVCPGSQQGDLTKTDMNHAKIRLRKSEILSVWEGGVAILPEYYKTAICHTTATGERCKMKQTLDLRKKYTNFHSLHIHIFRMQLERIGIKHLCYIDDDEYDVHK